MTDNLVQALLGHATPEWQQLAIVCAFIIFIPGTGLTQVMKVVDPFGWFDESLPSAWWRRRVQLFGISAAFIASLLILPAVASGTPYQIVLKVVCLGMFNSVATLGSYDFIRWVGAKVMAVFELLWASWKARKKKEIVENGGDVPDTDTEYSRSNKP